MAHRKTIKDSKGAEWYVNFNTDTFYYNCAVNILGDFDIKRVDGKKFTEKDLDELVDSMVFHKMFPDLGGTGGGPSCWVVSAGLTYPSDEGWPRTSVRTRHVMAAMAKGKLGAWVSTPIYDNHAHPHADSLQVCMIWFPEQRVNHILTDRPWYHIPSSKIRKGMQEKWAKRAGGFAPVFPETLHRAVNMLMKNFGWKRANPIEEVPVAAEQLAEKKIDGWADIS